MPIDLAHESLLTFRQVVAILPRQRGGRRVHLSTLYRWSTRGVRGVRLETARLGGRRITSHQALQRFVEDCSRAVSCVPARPARRRARELNLAEEELREAGI